ncbi:MAG: hypothetical protein FJ086_16135 [Deltaproteobacteria bacterium]|nr:hypothetical protein [Deltaproteobacteria bacterium]
MVGALLAALLALGCQGRTREATARDAEPPEVSAPAVAATAPAAVVDVPAAAPAGSPAPVTPANGPPAAVTAPTAEERPAPLWRVKDNKVRCVRAPCNTLDAVPVDSSAEKVQVAEVDLSPLGLSPKDTERLMAELHGKGLLIRGTVETRGDPRGKPYAVLRATALPSR